MKITITGSLGHIGKPLTQDLVEKKHEVTVISSQAERQKEIEALGATAAIGRLEDADFLTTVFAGADAVYTMTPPPNIFAQNTEVIGAVHRLSNNYMQAIQQAGVRRVVHLSSIGAHMDKDNGILRYAYEIEHILKQLSSEVSITFMRPVGFYYNLLAFIPAIKGLGVITSNYGGDDKNPWVSTVDIAAAIVDELTTSQPVERKVRYIASDELSCSEVAHTLGTAIGKPDLKWKIIPDEQALSGLITAGINKDTAKGFVEMNASMHSGKLYEDYYLNRPVPGKVKMADFARDFAKAYRRN
ncbi:MAG TPA: NAD(P)H-binding protein [Chitinophagaceae bacterium]|jgi:uncharacterized protein YbjT (DUF2867 family)|nr:NAD(P)H-binding protein [Chitinophagaceae bacterium]